MVAITTSGLTKRYGHRTPPVHPPWMHPAPEVRALEDLSIEVREGEIFGFLGPNGAGKSTTIRLLLGFLHPTPGSASVLGLDIVRDSVEIRGRIGYLPGGHRALRHDDRRADLLDYLGRADRPAADPPRRALRPARAVGRGRCAGRSATTRAGMRQKIGIIQALQHDPELAILDEPTEGLDPLMQRAFYDDPRRPPGRRPDDLLLVARPVRGRAGLRPGRDRPARAGSSRSRTSRALLARRKRNVEMRRRRADRRPRGRAGRQRRRRCRPTAGSRASSRATSGRSWPRSRGAPDHRPDDRAGPPRGGVPRAVRRRRAGTEATPRRRGRAAAAPEPRHEPRPVRPRLAVAADEAADRLRRAGRSGASFLPVVYASFGQQIKAHRRLGAHPEAADELRRRRHRSACRARSPSATSTRSRSILDLDLRDRVRDDRGRRRAPARHARGAPRPAAVAPDGLRDAARRARCCSSAVACSRAIARDDRRLRGRRRPRRAARSTGCRSSG